MVQVLTLFGRSFLSRGLNLLLWVFRSWGPEFLWLLALVSLCLGLFFNWAFLARLRILFSFLLGIVLKTPPRPYFLWTVFDSMCNIITQVNISFLECLHLHAMFSFLALSVMMILENIRFGLLSYHKWQVVLTTTNQICFSLHCFALLARIPMIINRKVLPAGIKFYVHHLLTLVLC